jgi:hypothetical protein
MTAHGARFVRCVVWQTDGITPLYVASWTGHAECVRALLGAGAGVNQATVGCARSMARGYGGTVCGDAWEPAVMHVYAVVCAGMRRGWRFEPERRSSP